MNPNHSNWTGRMPRTLTDAFGTDAESACAITVYRNTSAWIAEIAVAAVFAAMVVSGVIYLGFRIF